MPQTPRLGMKNRQAYIITVIKHQDSVIISIVGTANEDTTLNQAASGNISGLCKVAVAGHEDKCSNDTGLCLSIDILFLKKQVGKQLAAIMGDT